MMPSMKRLAALFRSSWLDAFLLDSRFGVRMLLKHRGPADESPAAPAEIGRRL